MADIRWIDRGETWIQWEIYGLEHNANLYNGFRIVIGTTTYNWTSSNPAPNTWHTTSNLNPGTSYTALGYANWAGTWYYVGSASTSTLSPPVPKLATPTFSARIASSNSLEIYYSAVSNADYYWIQLTNTSYNVLAEHFGGRIANFTNLSPGTTYYTRAKAMSNNQAIYLDSDWSGYTSHTTSNRPSNWSWTTAELNAFNKVVGYKIEDISHTRWNAFIDRVNEFRVYKGFSTIGGKMTSGDRVLTATRFNTVKNGIGAMNATGITDRSSGQGVLGSYLLILRDKLNEIT